VRNEVGKFVMKQSGTLRIKAIALTMVAGYVDGYALRVFGIYVSFMSGNTTLAGTQLGQTHYLAALAPMLAIAGFLCGSFLGNWFTHSQMRHSQRALFLSAAALLACFLVLNLYAAATPNLGILVLSLAMGMINPAVTRIGSEPISLTFVTGTLNKIGNHLALAVRRTSLPDAQGAWDTHFHRAFLEASVWAGFLSGAVLSGLASRHYGVLGMLPASIVLLALALATHSETATPPAQA
jgi:uncharacterized membrane protein YoaK (UPF0700 family)